MAVVVDEAPPVDVQDLVKTYSGRRVVDGLSWTAAAGQITAVLGPNGAGKTTAIECCEGLRRPDGGGLRVLGLDPVRDARALRARVGVMLQDGGLPTGARAGEVLRLVAAMHARPHPPGELLDRLALTEHAGTTVRRLSGGQRQRLALAVALVGRPRVLFLDEPTAGLDPQSRLAVWDLVTERRDDGVAVVLTTHLIDEAERLADQVVVVDAGRAVATGSPAQLAGNQTWLQFEGPGGLDLTGLELTGLRTDGPPCSVIEVEPGVYRVYGDPDGPVHPLTIAAVTTWCAQRQVTPVGLAVRRRTLEDAFLELTGRELR